MCQSFDRANGVPRPSSLCSTRSRTYVNMEDEAVMLRILMNPSDNVFVKTTSGRAYRDFEHLHSPNPLATFDVHANRTYIMK